MRIEDRGLRMVGTFQNGRVEIGGNHD